MVAASSPVLWYVARGSGVILMVLLTVILCIGVLQGSGRTPRSWPKFVMQDLHRNLALLAVVLLALHVLSAELDPFAPLGWLAMVVPFLSPYRPFWLGLGTLSLDLFAAVVVTSLLRAQLGYRAWRAVHWLAYLSWPIALLHCLGTGTDTRIGWVLGLDAACLAAVVVVASLVRLGRLEPRWRQAKRGGVAGVALLALALTVFTAVGPIRPGWAERAGTPSAQLGASQRGSSG